MINIRRTVFWNKTRISALAGAISLVLVGLSFANTWQGTKNSDFQQAANWDTAPTVNGSNDGDLAVQNGTANLLTYRDKEGSTTFNGQFTVGAANDDHTAGAIKVTGGSLTIDAGQYESILGQTAVGTVSVSGGNLTLSGKDTWLGNESSATGKLVVTGGAVNITEDFLIGRNDATGELDINGGSVVVAGSGGTTFDSGADPKKINFGAGDGEFKQTGSNKITFNGTDDADHVYVNFVTGSGGKLSLHSVASRDYFDELVKNGRIRIDDKPVTDPATKFQFNVADGQGVYSLSK